MTADHPQEHGVGGVERIRTQLGFVHYSGSLDAEPRSGITTDDVAALLAEVDRLQAQVEQLTEERDRVASLNLKHVGELTHERARNALLRTGTSSNQRRQGHFAARVLCENSASCPRRHQPAPPGGGQTVTHKVGRIVFLAEQPDGKCQLCGVIEETRPYGPRGEQVCFDCGMKDEPAAARAFDALLADDSPN